MQGRTRAIVASLAVGLIGAVAALAPSLGVAAGGEEPITVKVGFLPQYFDFGISPKVLPVGAKTPATLRLHLEGGALEDGSGWVGISAATLGLDQSISLNGGVVPSCPRQLLEADIDLEERVPEKCERAIVGRGEAHVWVHYPEQIPVNLPVTAAIYNGGTRGGATHLIVELPVSPPPSEPVWITLLIGNGETTRIPRIDEGFGVLSQLNLRLGRENFVTAECPTGKLTATLATTFRDGTETHEEAIRACTR